LEIGNTLLRHSGPKAILFYFFLPRVGWVGAQAHSSSSVFPWPVFFRGPSSAFCLRWPSWPSVHLFLPAAQRYPPLKMCMQPVGQRPGPKHGYWARPEHGTARTLTGPVPARSP